MNFFRRKSIAERQADQEAGWRDTLEPDNPQGTTWYLMRYDDARAFDWSMTKPYQGAEIIAIVKVDATDTVEWLKITKTLPADYPEDVIRASFVTAHIPALLIAQKFEQIIVENLGD